MRTILYAPESTEIGKVKTYFDTVEQMPRGWKCDCGQSRAFQADYFGEPLIIICCDACYAAAPNHERAF